MKKDIFIDNNIAKNFTNPADPEYKKLIEWLKEYDESKGDANAHLVITNKLLGEYNRSNSHAKLGSDNITILVSALQKQGRWNLIKNERIKQFQNQNFTNAVKRRLRSNQRDHDHIPAVLLSDRKMALAIDDNFIHDLTHFPGFNNVIAGKRPEQINYK